jgi:transcriptional regulator with XRE-family HTH domain
MPPKELDKLIADLNAWCKAKHGRQREFAAALGVSEQLVTNWLAGRRAPTIKHFFRIQQFLRKAKQADKRPSAAGNRPKKPSKP